MLQFSFFSECKPWWWRLLRWGWFLLWLADFLWQSSLSVGCLHRSCVLCHATKKSLFRHYHDSQSSALAGQNEVLAVVVAVSQFSFSILFLCPSQIGLWLATFEFASQKHEPCVDNCRLTCFVTLADISIFSLGESLDGWYNFNPDCKYLIIKL